MPQFPQQMRVTRTLNVPMLCLCKLAHPGYATVSMKCFMSHCFYCELAELVVIAINCNHNSTEI